MEVFEANKCEWAVNSLGNVLLCAPQFFINDLICAMITDAYLVIHYDKLSQIAFRVPDPIMTYLATAPSVLVVTFNAEGETFENDLYIKGIGQAD